MPFPDSTYELYWRLARDEERLPERLTGWSAIMYAELHGRTLCKYGDPTEGWREGLSVDEANEVARYDENLIYVDTIADKEQGTHVKD